MEILINNQPTLLHEEATLIEALEKINIFQYTGIAVAINEQVVPQPQWTTHTLNPEDRILIIRATQGG